MVRTFWSRLVALAVVAILLLVTLTSAVGAVDVTSAQTAVTYIPPVAGATTVDHFRAPSSPYAAGNRGIDQVTRPGLPVVASAAGEVIFAGAVAGSLHITVRHGDGRRSSYSYLAQILVQVGDVVAQGTPIGVTGPIFHFGVRDASGAYVDPELLFARGGGAHLVPGPDDGAPPLVEKAERLELMAVVAAGLRAGSRLVERARAIGHEAMAVSSSSSLASLAVEVGRWHDQQRHCTPADSPVPAAAGRRIAVLVGGLGSSSENAAIDGVDTPTLGYAPQDVVRFSYRGGAIPRPDPVGPLGALAGSTYDPIDTEADLHDSADRLLELVDRIARTEPGVPIDLIAHSQGGLLARLAVGQASPDLRQSVGSVVTLGTPHQGADLATAVAAIDARSPDGQALGAAARAVGIDLDLDQPSVAQMSETSPVISELARPVPEGVHLVSVGASGDLTVPDVRTVVPGADHATVHLSGPHAHDLLPGDPATTREIGLAIAGERPTCADLTEGLTDLVTSHLIAQGEDAIGLAIATRPP